MIFEVYQLVVTTNHREDALNEANLIELDGDKAIIKEVEESED